jgi:RNA polymerase I-specific transcription initiation factor RRN3
VHLFKKEYILFIETLLSVRWLKRCKEIIQLYHQFCVNLLTAKTEFLGLCLSKILLNFVPLESESDDYVNGKPTEEHSQQLNYIHTLLREIIEIIPMVPVILIIEVKKKFPYHKDSALKIAAYTYNILKILDYCPNMVHDVFELIFEK